MRYHSSLGPEKRKYTCWNGKFKYQNILNFKKNNFPEWTLFLAATKQLYQPSFPSICLSVCPSHFFHYVFIIISSWHFMSHYNCLMWCPCKRSRSEIKGQSHRGQKQILPQFGGFCNVTPVWIHKWLKNGAQSLKWHGKCALLFFTWWPHQMETFSTSLAFVPILH